MSGKLFKRKVGKKGLERGATYKRGSLGYDLSMVDRLVGRFFKEDELSGVEFFGLYVEEVYCPQLRAYPNLDIEGFIDAAIRRLEEDADFLHARYAGSVLNPLVSLMYELGYDNHVLDLGGIYVMQQNIIADIAATEEKPLSIVLRLGENPKGLDACYAADTLDHCTVRLFGSAESVGDRGFHSDYTLEDRVRQVGDSASNCVFRFPNVEDAVCTNQRIPVHRCRHRFSMTRGGKVFHMSVENSFFRDNNKLLIPDGPGKWKEVTPR